MAVLLKAIYRDSVIPVEIPMTFFTEIGNTFPQFIWKHKRPRQAKAILSKESQVRGISVPNFKLYYKAIVKRNEQNQIQKSIMGLPQKTNSSHRNKHTQLQTSDSGQWSQNYMSEERQALLTNGALEAGYPLVIDPCLTPCTETDPKCVKELGVRPKSLKLPEENSGETPEAIGIGKDFLTRTAVALEVTAGSDKRDYVKLKSFRTAGATRDKEKRQLTECENSFASYSSDRALISRI